jgi:putative ABC transport system permease protein
MSTVVWQFWQDFRYAFRTLSANPGFTMVATATMALGIGVNTALFTLVNAVLFRPTPVADPNSLYEIGSPVGAAEFTNFREYCESCAEVAAYTWVLPVMGPAGAGEVVHGNEVSPNYFRTMAIRPALGRFFDDAGDRDVPGVPIVLNYEFWRSRFQGDLSVVAGSSSSRIANIV